MGKVNIFVIGFLLFSGITWGQQKIYQEASLKHARVYFNGSDLAHEFKIKLPKGTSEIVVSNLAESVNDNTISISPDKPLSILRTSYTSDFDMAQSLQTPLNAVNDSIFKFEAKLQLLDNKITSQKNSLELLDTNRILPNTSGQGFTQELSKLLDFYLYKRTSLANELDALQQEKLVLQKKLVDLKARLQTGHIAGKKFGNGKIIVQISNPVAQEVSFILRYFTPLASWKAIYELNVPEINKDIQVVYKADVRQNTGLDWDNVSLSLTSGYANLSNIMPKWDTWFIDYINPVPIAVRAASVRKASVQTADQFQYTEMALEQPMLVANVSETELNVNFDINLPYTIQSGKQSNLVTLDEFSVPASYTYFSAVKLDPSAYLIATIKDYNQYNFLKGQANVMFEGMYVGKTTLDVNTTQDVLSLNLGKDPRVQVSRKLIKDKAGSRLLSGKKIDSYLYEIIVKNNKSKDVSITIQDQFPISSNTDIEISITQRDGAMVDQEKGLFTWDLKLDADQSKTLRFGYDIKYNKDQKLSL
ncbi:DUF4139 domain-containing protein [Myroides sp. LJL119]